MKSVLSAVLVTAFASVAMAEVTTLSLTGKGVDGNPCEVRIEKDGDSFKKIELKGATKVWEIISENKDGYGPDTHIASHGADDLTGMLSYMAPHLKAKKMGFVTLKDTYVVSTKDFPKKADAPAEDDLGPISMTITVSLDIDKEDATLKSAKVTSKAKAYVVPLANSEFTCGQ